MSGLRDDLVRALEQENDDLRARVRELERLLGMTFECPPLIGLTRQESIIFGLLLKNPLMSKELAISTMYLHKQDEADAKIVDVYICKLRKKLKPYKIDVQTQWGQGYFITREHKAVAEQLFATAAADAA